MPVYLVAEHLTLYFSDITEFARRRSSPTGVV